MSHRLPPSSLQTTISLGLACVGLVLLAGCGAPVAVRHMSPQDAQRQATSNVLTTGELSRRTQNLLYLHDLTARYRKDPDGALAALHETWVAGALLPADIVALAELSFHHAERRGGQPYYLAAALYAWAFLFPDEAVAAPGRFDPAERLAADLYNRGLAHGLTAGAPVVLTSTTYALPFGALDVSVDSGRLRWAEYRLTDFVSVADIEVEGFATIHRWPGIGAPMAAGIAREDGGRYDLLAPRARAPVTVVLRPTDVTRAMRAGRVQATLEFYPGYGEQTVSVGGHQVPLEAEPTATVALTAAKTQIWKREVSGFLSGTGIVEEQARLVSTRPYRPGLVPVVFVHGTGSSAIRWADLYNELDNDPRLHDRYQFWFFSYETGNPIIYSAMLLRDALEHAVTALDPGGRDPALRRMIVAGHSQGGLLTRAMVVRSGDAFWRNVSSKPFDEVSMSDETRALLRRWGFFEPLPFVRRVIFVATPHRGSYVAGNWLAHQVARLVTMPLAITRVMTDLVTFDREALAAGALRGAPTAVDNMTPGNPFVKTLSSLPIASGVAANSIIAVTGDGPPEGQNDGVVEYQSAHIDGVESELVVVSSHSCQANPHTIAEFRRILLEQAAGR